MINKLKNAWISTDTGLTGPNQTCSLLNEGKSEFKNDVVVDTKMSINKAIDTTNDYKLDVNGDVNIDGNMILQNIFSDTMTFNKLISGSGVTFDISGMAPTIAMGSTNGQLFNNDNTGTDTIKDNKATLGRVLFYDKNLSINNTISCASCHK